MYRFFFLIIILWGVFSFPQENIRGLYFPSHKVHLTQRTSAVLNESEPFTINKSIKINFQVSFWEARYMGLLVSGNSDNFNYFLQLITYRNPDTVQLQLVARNRIVSEIFIPKKSLIRNQWHFIQIEFNVLHSFVKFAFDQTTTLKNLDFPPFKNLIMTLGRSDINADQPEMAIKNVSISADDKNYLWVFRNSTSDVYNNLNAKITFPHMLLHKHIFWEKRLTFASDSIDYFGTAFNSAADSLYILNQNYYYKISTRDFTYDSTPYKKGHTHYEFYYMYDSFHKNILGAYAGGEGELTRLVNNRWTDIIPVGEKQKHFCRSGYFVNPFSGEFMSIAGYGWFAFKNDLRKYNDKNKSWEVIKYSGDFLEPRQVATTSNVSDGKVYFFGDIGNQSGIQENGADRLYDVFSLNLNNYILKKETDSNPENRDESHFSRNSWFSKQDTSLYFLYSFEDSNKTHFQLRRISLKDHRRYSVGEEKIFSGHFRYAELYFSETTNEFLLIAGHGKLLEVYTLPYPPANLPSPEYFTAKQNYLFIIGAVILIVLFAAGFYVFYKKKKPAAGQVTNVQPIHAIPNIQRLHLFGQFYISDKNGKDYSDYFSPKLKQLFVIILINSVKSSENTGISTESLTRKLWPDSSPESAKNTRGVTINNLRKLLEKIGGLELVSENNRWKIIFTEETFFFDFLLMLRLKNNSGENIDEALFDSFRRGEFLKNFDYEWAESFKHNINLQAIQMLSEFMAKEKDSRLRIKAAESICSIDRLNEEGMLSLISLLIEQGNVSIAKQKFEAFCVEYEKIFEQKYSRNFSEMLKK